MYRIHPISTGTLTTPKDVLTYRHDPHTTVVFPILSFLLEPTDGGPVVLVDAGIRARDDPYIERRELIVGPPNGGPGPLVDGLADRGVEPADVDLVVLSHLHHDHVGNVASFPDAEFVCQRDEWETAIDPLPAFTDIYPEEDVRYLDEEADLTLVDGDADLVDGIDLVSTPGHSPGSQSLVVETAAGPHAIIADLAYTQHNLDPSREHIVDDTGRRLPATPAPDVSYIPPGILVDVPAAYDSIERIRDRVGDEGVLIPGHDAEHEAVYPA